MEYTNTWIHEQIESCPTCQDRKASAAVGETYPCDVHYRVLYGEQCASIVRSNEDDVRLTRGRILTPVEQEKLIVLIDRFMDCKSVNTARHSGNEADETACEIEELLTKAGWYPDAEAVEKAEELRKLDRINQIISSGSSGPGEGERDQYIPPGSALGFGGE